jgi:hypothetical protein
MNEARQARHSRIVKKVQVESKVTCFQQKTLGARRERVLRLRKSESRTCPLMREETAPMPCEAEALAMPDNSSIANHVERSSRAKELVERYLALHDVRFRAGDIKALSNTEDNAMREKLVAEARNVIKEAQTILKGKAKAQWPRPAGR